MPGLQYDITGAISGPYVYNARQKELFERTIERMQSLIEELPGAEERLEARVGVDAIKRDYDTNNLREDRFEDLKNKVDKIFEEQVYREPASFAFRNPKTTSAARFVGKTLKSPETGFMGLQILTGLMLAAAPKIAQMSTV